MSFEDDISALIDRPCRRDGCAHTLPESCPSDDFCSEVCETTWRAENNGCRVEDYGDFGIDVVAPEGHPAVPSYSSPQEGAFDDQRPPRSFMELIRRQLSRMFDQAFLGDLDRFRENATGILHATRPTEERRPDPSVGLMQILPSAWAARQAEEIMRPPAVPPTDVERLRMRDQIARIFEVPPAMLDVPPPEWTSRPRGEFQVLSDPDLSPGVVNFVQPRPLPFGYVALDPAAPGAVPLFYAVESRYDHLRDRVVMELRVRLPPRPSQVNLTINTDEFIGSVRDRADEFQQLIHGEWIEEPEDMPVELERLSGLDAEEIVARARELGFVGVDPEPEIPPHRDQPET